jgi:hypothetical protein
LAAFSKLKPLFIRRMKNWNTCCIYNLKMQNMEDGLKSM